MVTELTIRAKPSSTNLAVRIKPEPQTATYILLETGDKILLETADRILITEYSDGTQLTPRIKP